MIDAYNNKAIAIYRVIHGLESFYAVLMIFSIYFKNRGPTNFFLQKISIEFIISTIFYVEIASAQSLRITLYYILKAEGQTSTRLV